MTDINSVVVSNSSISIYQIFQLLKRRWSVIFYLGLICIFSSLLYLMIFVSPLYSGTVFLSPAIFNEKILYIKEDVVKNFSLPNQYSQIYYDKCHGQVSFELKSKIYPENLIIFIYKDRNKTLTKLCSEILSVNLLDYQNKFLALKKRGLEENLLQLSSELTLLRKFLNDDFKNDKSGYRFSGILEKSQLRSYVLEQEIAKLKSALLPPTSVEAALAAPIIISENANRAGILKTFLITFVIWLFITVLTLLSLEFYSRRLDNK